MTISNPDSMLRNAALCGADSTVKELLSQNICSEEAKLYAMYNAILLGHDKIVVLLLDNGISPTMNNGAILKVLKLCNHNNIIELFKDYLE